MKRVAFVKSDKTIAPAETLWAEELSGNLYALRNVPFSTYGFAEGDIVEANSSDDGLQVARLHWDSGNGTIWINFASATTEDDQKVILNELTSVGCTYERSTSDVVGVTVPANLQIAFEQLLGYLNQVTDQGIVRGWLVSKEPKTSALTS